jgi:hypothetical protein
MNTPHRTGRRRVCSPMTGCGKNNLISKIELPSGPGG